MLMLRYCMLGRPSQVTEQLGDRHRGTHLPAMSAHRGRKSLSENRNRTNDGVIGHDDGMNEDGMTEGGAEMVLGV